VDKSQSKYCGLPNRRPEGRGGWRVSPLLSATGRSLVWRGGWVRHGGAPPGQEKEEHEHDVHAEDGDEGEDALPADGPPGHPPRRSRGPKGRAVAGRWRFEIQPMSNAVGVQTGLRRNPSNAWWTIYSSQTSVVKRRGAPCVGPVATGVLPAQADALLGRDQAPLVPCPRKIFEGVWGE